MHSDKRLTHDEWSVRGKEGRRCGGDARFPRADHMAPVPEVFFKVFCVRDQSGLSFLVVDAACSLPKSRSINDREPQSKIKSQQAKANLKPGADWNDLLPAFRELGTKASSRALQRDRSRWGK